MLNVWDSRHVSFLDLVIIHCTHDEKCYRVSNNIWNSYFIMSITFTSFIWSSGPKGMDNIGSFEDAILEKLLPFLYPHHHHHDSWVLHSLCHSSPVMILFYKRHNSLPQPTEGEKNPMPFRHFPDLGIHRRVFSVCSITTLQYTLYPPHTLHSPPYVSFPQPGALLPTMPKSYKYDSNSQ